MPVHQCRRMPEQHGNHHVERTGQHGSHLEIALGHQLAQRFRRDALTQQVDAHELAAVHPLRHGHAQAEQHGIQHAQQGDGVNALLAGAKGGEQHGGHGVVALRHFACRRHEAQRGRRQHGQRQGDAQPWNQRQQVHHGQEDEEQSEHGQRLLAEGGDALLHPLDALAGRDDVQSHGQKFSQGSAAGPGQARCGTNRAAMPAQACCGVCSVSGCAMRSRSTRSKCVGSCGTSMLASRGR